MSSRHNSQAGLSLLCSQSKLIFIVMKSMYRQAIRLDCLQINIKGSDFQNLNGWQGNKSAGQPDEIIVSDSYSCLV